MSHQNSRGSRSEFLKPAASLLLASGVTIPQTVQAKTTLPNPVGYAAISWPQNEFDDAMVDISALGFQGIQMLGRAEKSYGKRIETLNFPAILQAIRDASFSGWVIIEIDSYESRPGGPAEIARMNRDAAREMGFHV